MRAVGIRNAPAGAVWAEEAGPAVLATSGRSLSAFFRPPQSISKRLKSTPKSPDQRTMPCPQGGHTASRTGKYRGSPVAAGASTPAASFLAFVPHAFSFCIGGVGFLVFFFDLAMQFLLAKRASFYSGGEKRRNLLEPEHLSIPSLR